MGVWSVGITANDTARDLYGEYTAAFFHLDVAEAVNRIDTYVRRMMFDETDTDEWCNYMYSLADFMWKKGILTEDVRRKVLQMIDSGFGLESWMEAGIKTLNARKKKLEEFKHQILSAMPEKRRIKPNAHTKRIFEDGDLIAIQLQTKGKDYTGNHIKAMSTQDFHSLDGKYILIQMIQCFASWTSAIVPEVKDYWAIFRLFDGVYDQIPDNIDIHDLKDASFLPEAMSPLFTCESSMIYFMKRKFKMLGCYKDEIRPYLGKKAGSIHFGIHNIHHNPDSDFLASMGKEMVCSLFSESFDCVEEIIRKTNRFCRYHYHESSEANEHRFLQEERNITRNIRDALTNHGVILQITYGIRLGIVTVTGHRIDNLYIIGQFQSNGFGTKLLEYALSYTGRQAYLDVPHGHAKLLHICEKLGMKRCETANSEFIRMVFDPQV